MCVRVVIIIIRFLADCHYCKRCVYFLSFFLLCLLLFIIIKININSKKNCHSKKVKLYFISTNSPSPYHQQPPLLLIIIFMLYSPTTILSKQFYLLITYIFYIYITKIYIFSPLYYVLLFFFCIEKQKNNPNINSHHIKILFLLQCE